LAIQLLSARRSVVEGSLDASGLTVHEKGNGGKKKKATVIAAISVKRGGEGEGGET